MMEQSNQKQVEVLSEISDIIVRISDEDLERMESLAEQITPFDQELGSRILDACSLLAELNDDVESALERLEPETEEIEDVDMDAAEAEATEADAEGEEEAEEQGRTQSKRQE